MLGGLAEEPYPAPGSPPILQGLADIDAEKQEVEVQLQECAETAASDLGLVLDKTLK